VLLALTSLFLALLACEVALRWVFVAAVPLGGRAPLDIRVAGGEIRVRQREYETWHRYNRFAFRDAEFRTASLDEATVLVLGDSFAEGLGVSAEARFSSLLVPRLQPMWPGRRVRVVNAGQIGTAPSNYLDNLAEFGMALRPDVVVLTVYAGNDFFHGRALAGWHRTVQEHFQPPAAPSWAFGYVRRAMAFAGGDHDALVRRLHGADLWSIVFGGPIDENRYRALLAPLKVTDAELQAATEPMNPAVLGDFHAGLLNPAIFIEAVTARVAHARGQRPTKLMTARYADVRGIARGIARARDILAARDSRLIVLVVPDVFDVMPDAFTAFLRGLAITPNLRMRIARRLGRQLVTVLERRGIAVADLRAPLVDASEPTYWVMDGHLNPAGHRIVADVVAGMLGGGVSRAPIIPLARARSAGVDRDGGATPDP
jgi:hypothetical protein